MNKMLNFLRERERERCRNFYIQYYYLILQKTVFHSIFRLLEAKKKLKRSICIINI